MNTLILAALAFLLITNLVLVLKSRRDAGTLESRLEEVSGTLVRLDTVLRDESRQMRVDAREAQTDFRDELHSGQKVATDSLAALRAALDGRFDALRSDLASQTMGSHESLSSVFGELRQTVADRLQSFTDVLDRAARQQEAAGQALRGALEARLEASRTEQEKQARDGREEIRRNADESKKATEALTSSVRLGLDTIRTESQEKLDQMRAAVDEKLQSTLERRLGESFKMVGHHLEEVQRGLGEMRNLASGVGDLKKVLTNVKSRGTWGEVQLGNLLDQSLAPAQFERNVCTKQGSRDRVEFAVKLPGTDDGGAPVWLPIDAKFPLEDWHRLQDAAEKGNAELVEESGRQLETSVRLCAATIAGKYLDPPRTTDFAILFLPTEGLYAEVLRRPGLSDSLQRDVRIVLAGPTTLAAILCSLQMGFQTLAISKRSSEVWQVLAAVKSEFAKFGDSLDAVKTKLEQAATTIDKTKTRSRAIERSLRTVSELPPAEARRVLPGLDLAIAPGGAAETMAE